MITETLPSPTSSIPFSKHAVLSCPNCPHQPLPRFLAPSVGTVCSDCLQSSSFHSPQSGFWPDPLSESLKIINNRQRSGVTLLLLICQERPTEVTTPCSWTDSHHTACGEPLLGMPRTWVTAHSSISTADSLLTSSCEAPVCFWPPSVPLYSFSWTLLYSRDLNTSLHHALQWCKLKLQTHLQCLVDV